MWEGGGEGGEQDGAAQPLTSKSQAWKGLESKVDALQSELAEIKKLVVQLQSVAVPAIAEQ